MLTRDHHVFAAIALLTTLSAAQTAPAQCVLDWSDEFGLPGLDGGVGAFAVFDDGSGPALYVGGWFVEIGGVTVNCIAKWDGSRWWPLAGGLTGGTYGRYVNALAVLDDGAGPALYVGGVFTAAGGVSANNIAKWDGTQWLALGNGVTSAGPGNPQAGVWALGVFDDGGGPGLYVGGKFTKAGGQSAKNIAKWKHTHWSALGAGPDKEVYSLTAFDDGTGPALYVGGNFTTVGGISASHIARWDGWTWSPLGTGTSATVYALTSFDDGSGPTLYAGGGFSTAGGVAAKRIARWKNASWSDVGGGIDGSYAVVYALSVLDEGRGPELYAGGQFTGAGGTQANSIARWDGAAWSALGMGVQDGTSPGYVAALMPFESGRRPALFVGGGFNTAGGRIASGIVRWQDGAWLPLGEGQGLNGSVAALATWDAGRGDALYAGGRFTVAGDTSAKYLARWDGVAWSALAGTIGGVSQPMVYALAPFDDVQGPALYVGGYFTTAGGVSAKSIARFDGANWSALGPGISEEVRALAVFDDGNGPALYAGGSFTWIGDLRVNRVARWDGLNWRPLGSGVAGGNVYALAVYDDGGGPALYAGGYFTSAGEVSANRIAKWNGSTWSALGSGLEGADSAVAYALAVYDDGRGPGLYAAGAFSIAGGVSANQIAKWDGAAWSALGDGLTIGNGPFVRSLAVFDNGRGAGLYAGGGFRKAGDVSVPGIARWDGARWWPLGSGIEYHFGAQALAVYDDGRGAGLYAGGDFTSAGGKFASKIAKWGCVPGLVLGDLNCDGVVNHEDVDPFVLALNGRAAYEAQYPACNWLTGDCNGDGYVTFDDIDPFVALLSG